MKKTLFVIILLILPSLIPNLIFGTSTKIEDNQWTMFCKDGHHTNVAYSFLPLSEPLKDWDLNVSLSSSSATIGNFTSNVASKTDLSLGIVYADAGKVSILDKNGKKMWELNLGIGIRATPSLADLNGNGLLDIVVATANGNISLYEPRIGYSSNGYTWDTNNLVNERVWFYSTNSEILHSSPLFADLSSDGIEDVVIGAGDKLFAINGMFGTHLWNFSVQGNITTSPALYEFGTTQIRIVITSFDFQLKKMHTYMINDKGN
ncbi:MAG: hypothetical protein AB1779_03985, partial [Candidatus Thermoplasmatota archaeon]